MKLAKIMKTVKIIVIKKIMDLKIIIIIYIMLMTIKIKIKTTKF